MAFWVYMLRCADASYYVGHTEDIERRIAEHQAGAVPGYTMNRRPVGMVFCESFDSRQEALERERQIKGWGRAKKEALMLGDWERISHLAHQHRSS
jgi:predicted GIY-YIG superfamily endonuclease